VIRASFWSVIGRCATIYAEAIRNNGESREAPATMEKAGKITLTPCLPCIRSLLASWSRLTASALLACHEIAGVNDDVCGQHFGPAGGCQGSTKEAHAGHIHRQCCGAGQRLAKPLVGLHSTCDDFGTALLRTCDCLLYVSKLTAYHGLGFRM
jgi:hypothetical protein